MAAMELQMLMEEVADEVHITIAVEWEDFLEEVEVRVTQTRM